jgi:hypothetical protein
LLNYLSESCLKTLDLDRKYLNTSIYNKASIGEILETLLDQFVKQCPPPESYPEVMKEWGVCFELMQQIEQEVAINKSLPVKRFTEFFLNWKLSEIRRSIKPEGYTIKSTKRKNLGCGGEFRSGSKKLILWRGHHSSKFYFLYVLYHELRHKQQFQEQGFFYQYYSESINHAYSFAYKNGSKALEPLSSPYICYAAELDADLYALKRLNEIGYRPKKEWYSLYPIELVMTINLYRCITKIRKRSVAEKIHLLTDSDSWKAFIQTCPLFNQGIL